MQIVILGEGVVLFQAVQLGRELLPPPPPNPMAQGKGQGQGQGWVQMRVGGAVGLM